MNIDALVKDAIAGNKIALEGVIAEIQDNVYYLALRMLANPDDAKDATQEILIKIITNLSSFRSDSQFTTWVYRVAANYLISEKKILKKDPGLTFSAYKEDLESDLQEPSDLRDDLSYHILINELRISCTMAVLLCLNPAHRMAYIIGDILDIDHSEASEILSISKANFRKQLSRSRSKVIEFTAKSCGLVNECAKCTCDKKITGAINRNRIYSDKIYFSNNTQYSHDEIKESLANTKKELKTLSLHKSINSYKSPVELGDIFESLVFDGISGKKTSPQNNREVRS